MIANLDYNFGVLRERLEELKLADNIILCFVTDNGTAAGGKFDGFDSEALEGFNAGMRGKKASICDGGHRVPFFIRWPAGGIDEGRDISTLAAHIDLLPTLAELCRISIPASYHLDGRSLVPLLKNNESGWNRDHIVLQFHGGTAFLEDRIKETHSCIMTERWRLLSGNELYDIETDPAQRKDVAADHPEVVAQLRALYEPYWKSVLPGMRPVRIDIGNPAENPVSLCSQDWYMASGNPPWNFRLIRNLPRVTAPWMLDANRPGRYRLNKRTPHNRIGLQLRNLEPVL